MLFPINDLDYSRIRITRDDNSFYDVVEVKAPDLAKVEFHKAINAESQLKPDDVAQLRMLKALRRGVKNPVAVVWNAYNHNEARGPIDLAVPEQELVHISKNATITHHLRYLVSSRNYQVKQGRLQVRNVSTEKDSQAQRLLDMLYAENRLKVYQANPEMWQSEIQASLDPWRDVVAVGQIGLPSLYGRQRNVPVVFNTSFFLFEEEDFISEFSVLGDAYSLQISGSTIESPPLFNRSALLFTAQGSAQLRQVSLQDFKLYCLGQEYDLSSFLLNQMGEYSLYTRYFGVEQEGKTLVKTPRQPNKIDFVIIDRAIVGYKVHGEVEIPHNGFVVSLPLSDVAPGRYSNEVRYAFLDGSQYRTGIQCGPGLLQDGAIILDEQTLADEQFFRKRYHDGKITDYGVVPTDYAEDIDQTRAARLAIGVDFAGGFRVLAVESVNQGMAEVTGESSGVTLQELALLLKNRNYQHALNLDGGGSANIQYFYGHLLKGADRRGLPGVTYERLVPSVGVIRK